MHLYDRRGNVLLCFALFLLSFPPSCILLPRLFSSVQWLSQLVLYMYRKTFYDALICYEKYSSFEFELAERRGQRDTNRETQGQRDTNRHGQTVGDRETRTEKRSQRDKDRDTNRETGTERHERWRQGKRNGDRERQEQRDTNRETQTERHEQWRDRERETGTEKHEQRHRDREARTVERQGNRETDRERERRTERERDEEKVHCVETEHKRVTVSVFVQHGVLFLKADTFGTTKPSITN